MEELFKKLNYQPTSLTALELERPEEVIECFFENYPIHTTREHLWNLYKGWVHHASEYTDAEIAMSMMNFYSQFVDFLDASLICAEKRKGEK
ncbi:hypothetical protein SAMN04487898_109204 [Pedobacter sp. ok626]|uniref:hypothetical protein n=1 Tax=Pedobacter sp. ok626 TaxID=1761882 RepID=UPI000882335B|nr:hypothetical protein [Pedobacter sp. ok626]SDK58800.1 hypothetical protein SAMN04487898_109204 [Pedobacter sp. ok626]